MAEPALQGPSDAAPQEVPKPAPQEAAPNVPSPTGPMSLNEALTGKEAPISAAERERRSLEEGMAKLNELGKGFRSEAEIATQKFGQETTSWWSRIKGMFARKKDGEPGTVPEASPEKIAKAEEAIAKEVEKADAAYAAFKAKYEEIMASGDAAGLKSLERSLSDAYDELAPKVAAEGAKEAKAMRKALKTGELPEASAAGAKLNDVNRRLEDVRARLGGATPEQIAAARAPKPGPAATEVPIETAMPTAEPLAAEARAKRPKAPPEAPPVGAPTPVEVQKMREAEELRMRAKGTQGERMVDAYLALKDLEADQFGEIIGTGFNPRKGEIRVNYADGSAVYRFASGLMLRSVPGALQPEKLTEADFAEQKKPAGVVSGEVKSKEPAPEPKKEEESVIVKEEAEEGYFTPAELAEMSADPDLAKIADQFKAHAKRLKDKEEMGQRVDKAMEREDRMEEMGQRVDWRMAQEDLQELHSKILGLAEEYVRTLDPNLEISILTSGAEEDQDESDPRKPAFVLHVSDKSDPSSGSYRFKITGKTVDQVLEQLKSELPAFLQRISRERHGDQAIVQGDVAGAPDGAHEPASASSDGPTALEAAVAPQPAPEPANPESVAASAVEAPATPSVEKKEIDPRTALRKATGALRAEMESPTGYMGMLREMEEIDPAAMDADTVTGLQELLDKLRAAADEAGQLKDFEPERAESMGLSREEVVALNIADLAPEYGRAAAKAYQRAMKLAEKLLSKAQSGRPKAPSAKKEKADASVEGKISVAAAALAERLKKNGRDALPKAKTEWGAMSDAAFVDALGKLVGAAGKKVFAKDDLKPYRDDPAQASKLKAAFLSALESASA